MAYLGAKAKCSEHIIKVLNNPCFDGFDYLEPFVGYAHILRRINNKNKYLVGDNNILLITLLDYLQSTDYDYPHISKNDYEYLRNDDKKKNIIPKSFAAFAYSYNGKEFGGYVYKKHGRNYPEERFKYYDLLRDNDTFMKSKIYLKSFDEYNPKGMLIYCDPPYQNTTKYKTSENFDHEYFWDVVRKWSKNNYVFVSEYRAPSDFITITSKKKYSSLCGRGSDTIRTEKLFAHNSIKNKSLYKYIIKNL